jgi:hypothetical protein
MRVLFRIVDTLEKQWLTHLYIADLKYGLFVKEAVKKPSLGL